MSAGGSGPEWGACQIRGEAAAPTGHGVPFGGLSASLPFRLEYLQQKQSRATSDAERQALEKQVREAEKEVQDIR